MKKVIISISVLTLVACGVKSSLDELKEEKGAIEQQISSLKNTLSVL